MQVVVRASVEDFVRKQLAGEAEGKTKKYVCLSVTGLFATVALQLIAYAVAEMYSVKTEEEIQERIDNIRVICPDFDQPIGNLKSFKDSGLAVAFWGAFLGVICQNSWLGG